MAIEVMATDKRKSQTDKGGFRGCPPVAKVVFGILLLLAAGMAKADSGFFAILGGQRVGTSVMPFLKIPVGARAEAMGGAYVAIANDPFAVFWNPAGIAQIENRWKGKFTVDPERQPEGVKGPAAGYAPLFRGDRTLGLVRINWLADISYDVVSFIHPLPVGVIGISLANLSMAEMEITTEYRPEGVGEYFSFGDALVGLTYALEMTDNFSWGVTLKYASEELADTRMDNVMIDIGTYYWTGLRDLRIGVALVHFGPNARPEGTFMDVDQNGDSYSRHFTAYAPPTEFRLGGAMTLFAFGPNKLLSAFQLNHPVDNAENLKLGLEYGFKGMLFMRGGYKVNTDEDRWTFGAGVRVPWRGYAVSADYSYTDFGILDQAQRISLGIAF